MEAILHLIENYGLDNPTKNNSTGAFNDPKFKELYGKLVAEGMKSELDALKIGAMVEELDIVDLQRCVNDTTKSDIRMVYGNPMKGSRNHLRAFVSTIESLGAVYEPKYLTKSEFDKIVDSEIERGEIIQ